MQDAFALLNEPRRPWLEAEALKQKFLALSSAVHPDRVSAAFWNRGTLISTRLQPGVSMRHELITVSTVFQPPKETVETVSLSSRSCHPAEAGC
jgi:hypothetical protein